MTGRVRGAVRTLLQVLWQEKTPLFFAALLLSLLSAATCVALTLALFDAAGGAERGSYSNGELSEALYSCDRDLTREYLLSRRSAMENRGEQDPRDSSARSSSVTHEHYPDDLNPRIRLCLTDLGPYYGAEEEWAKALLSGFGVCSALFVYSLMRGFGSFTRRRNFLSRAFRSRARLVAFMLYGVFLYLAYASLKMIDLGFSLFGATEHDVFDLAASVYFWSALSVLVLASGLLFAAVASKLSMRFYGGGEDHGQY